MGLRNAFEELTTEGTLRALLRAINWPKDTVGRPRVIVDGGSITVAQGPLLQSSGTAGQYRAWWDPYGATVSMEQREIERGQSIQRGILARQKWTYS